MQRQRINTQRLHNKARKFMPNGVNSSFRDWGDDTFVVARGKGAHIWDMDDNRYIDYRLGFGPIILGHADPTVNKNVCEAIENGVSFAATNLYEIELAERFTRMTGTDMARLCNTGTEATMHALRIARAHTGRERFIKFEGQYHGNHDYVMYSTPSTAADTLGSRSMPRRAKASEGIPAAIRNYMISLPFNDTEMLEAAVQSFGDEVAAIFVEPVMGNSAGIVPRPGWLERMRMLCDQYGIVLIFDEVKTGFRLAPGGAQEYFGVKADLAAYAKAMGNGFPVAAVAGKRNIMAVIEEGKVAHGGTYCGNMVAAAAACATLQIIEDEPVIEEIFARGQELMNGIHEVLNRFSIAHVVTGLPPMFGLLLGTEETPLDYRSYCHTDFELYAKIVAGLLDRGVFPDEDPLEPWFLCRAHSAQDVADTLTALEEAVQDATGVRPYASRLAA